MRDNIKGWWYWRYWGRNFKASFDFFDRGDRLSVLLAAALTLILSALSLLGINLVSDGWDTGPTIALGLAIWLIVLLTVVTPARLWNEHRSKLESLTTPKIEIQNVDIEDGDDEFSYRFPIHNPTGSPIHKCYGRVLEYSTVPPKQPSKSLPRDLMPLYWDWRTHESNTEASIGAGSTQLLSLGFRKKDGGDFTHIARSPRRDGIMGTKPLDEGTYEFDIEVGSNEAEIPPTKRKIGMVITENDVEFYYPSCG